jgi:nitrite reductase/ring-hydroxylating ferredoxin subunit
MPEVTVCTTSTIADGTAQRFDVEGHRIAIARVGETYYALGDRCSHEDFSLAEGIVDVANCEIECARHGAMFSLKDGGPMSFPATKPVAHYDVAINNGRVELVLS